MNLLQDASGGALSSQRAIALLNNDDASVIDVRNESDYEQGHIVNALNITADKIKKGESDLDAYKDKPLLLYCQSGQIASTLIRPLKKQGFNDVYALRGGVAAWQNENLPLTKDT